MDDKEFDRHINKIVDELDIKKILERLEVQKNKEVVKEEIELLDKKDALQSSLTVSTKTKEAHEQLYKNYVDSYNNTIIELSSYSIGDDKFKQNSYRGLKVNESYYHNAVRLHELYFENCFDRKSNITNTSLPYIKLSQDFNSFQQWQRHFIATGMSAINGWVVCGLDIYSQRYVNFLIDSHDGHVMIGVVPILVVDMWNHSYFLDHLNDKYSYLLSQMKEINWDVVSKRMEKLEKVIEVMK
jgi:Fe-Mn family superoxide dismutase